MPDQISDADFIASDPEKIENIPQDQPDDKADNSAEVELPSLDDLAGEEIEEKPDEDEEQQPEDEERDEDEPQPLGTLSFKEIKERFKSEDGQDIFEAVPNLRRALILDQRFHATFTNIEEAEEAAQNAEFFNTIDRQVMSGDPSGIINAINKENPKVLEPFIKNLLPILLEANDKVFNDHIVYPIFNNLLNEIKDTAYKSRNKNLWLAVKHVSNALNGTPDVPARIPLKRSEPQDNPERRKLEADRAAFNAEKYTSFTETINGEVDRLLERDIEKVIDSADPNKVFTTFTKRHLRDDIFTDIIEMLKKDSIHTNGMGNLLKLAARSGYAPESKSRVKTAILARARKDLRVIAGKHLKGVIGGIKKTGKVQQFSASGRAPANGAQTRLSKAPPSSAINYREVTDDEILQGKLKLKPR